MNAPLTPEQRNRNRGLLILIVAIFLGSALLAGALRLSGWRPAGMKNHGELLDPPGDLRAIIPRLEDGGDYAWNPVERTWRIVVAPPTGCDAPCVELSRQLDTVWQLAGRRADHLHILWMGQVPAGAVRNRAWRELVPDAAIGAQLPRVDDPAGVPVYVVDPNGFTILRYAPGFDPAHLHTDLTRLLKLK